jgi:hypothetical protein
LAPAELRCYLQAVLQALLSSTKGVSSAARRFRLRCLKSVILLLDASPDLDFDLGSSEAADETAMLTQQEKRQQVCAVQACDIQDLASFHASISSVKPTCSCPMQVLTRHRLPSLQHKLC